MDNFLNRVTNEANKEKSKQAHPRTWNTTVFMNEHYIVYLMHYRKALRGY
jgi:hypothetical protein